MTTFGSTTEDSDGVPIGQGDVSKVTPIDRGPPGEMRMTEAELRGDMRLIADAKKSMGELATIEGVMAEMKMLRAMMDDLCAQNERLLGMHATLRGELESFRQQWNIERQSWLRNGGSTTPEDMKGGTDS